MHTPASLIPVILVEVISSQLNITILTFKCLQVNSREPGVGVGTLGWNFEVLRTGPADCAANLILASSESPSFRQPTSQLANQHLNIFIFPSFIEI